MVYESVFSSLLAAANSNGAASRGNVGAMVGGHDGDGVGGDVGVGAVGVGGWEQIELSQNLKINIRVIYSNWDYILIRSQLIL